MSLQTNILQQAIFNAFAKARQGTNRNDTLPNLASDLASAMEAFIKSGNVQTTGPDPQGGTVNSTGKVI